jgi:hypothetical protein
MYQTGLKKIEFKTRDWYVGRFLEQIDAKIDKTLVLINERFDFSMVNTLRIPHVELVRPSTLRTTKVENGASSVVLISSGELILVFTIGPPSQSELLQIGGEFVWRNYVASAVAVIEDCKILEGIRVEWYNLFRRGFGYPYNEALEMAYGLDGRPDQSSYIRAKEQQVSGQTVP